MYKIFSSSINNHQKLKTTQMSFSRWMNKSTIVHPIKFYFAIKWVNYLHTPEWTSKALFWVKEASLKSLHIIWFHLNDSIEIIKLSWWRTDRSRVRSGEMVRNKGTAWGSFLMELLCIYQSYGTGDDPMILYMC